MRTTIKRTLALTFGTAMLSILVTGCVETSYIYQNGSTYNDYEVATNYRIRNTTNKHKVQNSKAPNWRKYNQQNKFKRYN